MLVRGLPRAALDRVVKVALEEDLVWGDITTEYVVEAEQRARARLLVQSPGVLAGLPVAVAVFRHLDPEVIVRSLKEEGEAIADGDSLAQIEGAAWALLQGERVALNFLQRLSGIATMTADLVARVKPYGVFITDTRKTTPGLRVLEKYAVMVGGGRNHRFGLSDAVLIKDNHIRLAGGITPAVQRVRRLLSHTRKIEVEVENESQVDEALACGVDIIMLDNMPVDLMKRMVKRIGGRALVEASGGITPETVEAVAQTGVDLISVGAITHSVKALDISMEID